MPLREKVATLKELAMPLCIAGGVLGSIYVGIATPSEAAGVGVILVILAAAINRKLNWAMVRDSLYETLRISCMLTWLFFGAQTIIGAYTLAGGTNFVTSAIKALDLGPWGTVILMNLIWIFLGCFLDWIGILFLTAPIFLPLIIDWGFDLVWFGVVYCMNMHVAYLSPPFAPSAFYTKSITPPDITMTQIYKATLPYLYWTLLATAIVTAWPGLSLWLPKLLLRH
jgi:tripartite ATP-independent transporter DctM subunit